MMDDNNSISKIQADRKSSRTPNIRILRFAILVFLILQLIFSVFILSFNSIEKVQDSPSDAPRIINDFNQSEIATLDKEAVTYLYNGCENDPKTESFICHHGVLHDLTTIPSTLGNEIFSG
jgi:hypothetical protein